MFAETRSPELLRRKADKWEELADRMPSDGDAETLRLMAAECRELADCLEQRAQGPDQPPGAPPPT
jgi:hypothetical protein